MVRKLLLSLSFSVAFSSAMAMDPAQPIHDAIGVLPLEISTMIHIDNLNDSVYGKFPRIMDIAPGDRGVLFDALDARVGLITLKPVGSIFAKSTVSNAFATWRDQLFRPDLAQYREITAKDLAPKHGRMLSKEEEEILQKIDAIPRELAIKSPRVFAAHMHGFPGNINGPINQCISEINALDSDKREFLLIELGKKIDGIKYKTEFADPDGDLEETRIGNEKLDAGFRERLKGIADSIRIAIENAKNPPPVEDERLDPTPVFVSLPAVDTVLALVPKQIRHYADERNQLPGTELDGLPGAFVDNTRVAFETRLINYAISHMTSNYKPDGVAWNTAPIRVRIDISLGELEDIHRLDPIMQRKEKVAFVESLLHSLYDNPAGLVPTSVDDVLKIMDLQAPSHIFTRMEKVKALPSVNWNEVTEKYVFDVNGALKRRVEEDDTAYWRRIGNYVINVYKEKIRPHINPDRLLESLIANQDIALLPLSTMFPAGIYDAGTVFEALTRTRIPGDPGFGLVQEGIELEAEVPKDIRDSIFSFDVSAVSLDPKDETFKSNLAKAHRRVDNYMIQTLGRLFGTLDPIREGLSWHWSWHDFSADRIELCQKVLLTFHHFNRPGENYNADVSDIAAFAGRATHCGDGKKTAIEATSSRTLCALSGEEAEIVVETLDTLLEKTVFRTLKVGAVELLSEGHDHRENVTMLAMIKHRNKAFWGITTDIEPQLNLYAYKESDYGIDTKDGFAAPNTDKVLQYAYQHVYVGPHKLVNTIYDYLSSGTDRTRKNFMGFACKMLANNRPYEDLSNLAPAYFELSIKERFCELVIGGKQDHIHPVKPSEDFIFTRQGIERLLFYAGYLAWSGRVEDHPLQKDWEENTEWLKRKDLKTYQTIYKEPEEIE